MICDLRFADAGFIYMLRRPYQIQNTIDDIHEILVNNERNSSWGHNLGQDSRHGNK